MYTSFHQLPDTARLWVYGAPRPFTTDEIATIEAAAPTFLGSWATHGTPLKASYQVLMGQFLLLAVDEAAQQASGCSIDSSVGFIRTLEQTINLSLTDRSLVYFRIAGSVKAYPLSEVKALIGQGIIHPQTELINTLVVSKGELEQKWLLPAGESWLKRHFKKATV